MIVVLVDLIDLVDGHLTQDGGDVTWYVPFNLSKG